METIYKLTRPDHTTYDNFKWEPGKLYTFPGHGQLCTAAYAHAYRSPAMAAMMNPIHANYDPAILWRGEGIVELDDGVMLGLIQGVVHEQAELPRPTLEQRVTFGLRCAMLVYHDPDWTAWAERWLSKVDRSAQAARAARAAGKADQLSIYAAIVSLADEVLRTRVPG